MSLLSKICAGLFISSLGMTAYAANPETEGQSPAQEPGPVQVEVTNSVEVIQVLHIGVKSERQIIELISQRNPDADLQQFIDRLSQDVMMVEQKLEELAASKSVGLAPEELTATAKLIEAQMMLDIQTLSEKSDAEFRAAAIQALIINHEKALGLYAQVEQANVDADLIAAIGEFRPVTEENLEQAQHIQHSSVDPVEPQQPAQPIPVE
jgi:predicted outer membrane protein